MTKGGQNGCRLLESSCCSYWWFSEEKMSTGLWEIKWITLQVCLHPAICLYTFCPWYISKVILSPSLSWLKFFQYAHYLWCIVHSHSIQCWYQIHAHAYRFAITHYGFKRRSTDRTDKELLNWDIDTYQLTGIPLEKKLIWRCSAS